MAIKTCRKGGTKFKSGRKERERFICKKKGHIKVDCFGYKKHLKDKEKESAITIKCLEDNYDNGDSRGEVFHLLLVSAHRLFLGKAHGTSILEQLSI